MDVELQVAAVRRLYEALADGDVPTLDGLLAEDFRGRIATGFPLGIGGEYAAREEMKSGAWWRIGAAWKVRAEPSEIVAMADGRVMVRGVYRGTARSTGQPVEADFVHLIGFDGSGVIATLDQITDTASWAQSLRPVDPPYETLEVSVEDGVATICLNRPVERNAIDGRVPVELLRAARAIAGDDRVRAVLICGNGPSLTVGGDIDYFIEHAPSTGMGALLGDMTSTFHDAFRILSTIDAPIVTAAHGAVAGGGLGLVFAADIVVAADDSRYVAAFSGLGVSGDGGGTWWLPRLVGPRRAAQMYLENIPLDAAEALESGVVTTLVPAADVRAEALAVARRLASGPTRGFAAQRRLLRESWDRTLSDQLAAETANLITTGNTADAQGAIRAFVDKRRATFGGR